jgi:hypothetical protein
MARATSDRKNFFMVIFSGLGLWNCLRLSSRTVAQRSTSLEDSRLTIVSLSAELPKKSPRRNHPRCTRMFRPSIRTGKTATFACSGGSASPVVVLNAQECHGQTTASPSSQPPPKGPCRCGQILSNADSRPPTLARQMATPAASASITSPGFGASSTVHNLTHSAKPFSSSCRVHSVPYEMLKVQRRNHASQAQATPPTSPV